jgi:murein DD-endopeptidase MepM/ murein hydrolase activator NlpD
VHSAERFDFDAARSSRLRRVGFAALLAAALLGAVPAAAAAQGAQASSQPTGGARAGVIPKVTDLVCAQNCNAHKSVHSASNLVRAHAGTVLRLKGERLATVQKVVFLGRAGTSDDVLVSPKRVGRTSVLVTVPATASSGGIAVATADGSSTKARRKVQIHRHAPPPPPAEPTGPPSESLIWPIRGPITGKFGEDRGSHYHSGLDISADGGKPIKAAAAGTIIHRGWYGGYGNYTCIAHVTITTCYAHMSDYAASATKGAKVTQGQVIGYVGNTGNSSGNHLHFEVRKGLQMGSTTVDPTKYLP